MFRVTILDGRKVVSTYVVLNMAEAYRLTDQEAGPRSGLHSITESLTLTAMTKDGQSVEDEDLNTDYPADHKAVMIALKGGKRNKRLKRDMIRNKRLKRDMIRNWQTGTDEEAAEIEKLIGGDLRDRGVKRVKRVKPDKPIKPVEPVEPVKPDKPDKPIKPVEPVEPVKPKKKDKGKREKG